ncbi:suppressor of fused domain protein [Crocinitomix catalasitica]|uniref:suppressor of fused domain protein n=1 Tax=Crocinitomix catalasitica TaxID=184607 RepID=UPI000482F5F1|nr:suppressor of fused domain protein [Crocinitomix catalasitica]
MNFEEVIRQFHPETEFEVIRENPTYNFIIKSARLDKNYIIFTEGLSKFDQPVNDQKALYKHIELYFLLPDYIQPTQDHWPVNWLDILAEIPSKKNTWFGPGDTIPAGQPPKSLSTYFDANTFMLVDPIAINYLFEDTEEMSFKALGILPLFDTEIAYKLKNSATLLMRKLLKANVSELVDTYRTPVCRKKILGF